jgi:hypothetical protein
MATYFDDETLQLVVQMLKFVVTVFEVHYQHRFTAPFALLLSLPTCTEFAFYIFSLLKLFYPNCRHLDHSFTNTKEQDCF